MWPVRWLMLIGGLVLGFVVLTLIRAPRGSSSIMPAKLASSPVSATSSPKPDFEKEIKPIFQSRCMPCHFQGGQVYEKMPFDKPETITRLGTKLFTRIKDEKERQVIREFIAQP